MIAVPSQLLSLQDFLDLPELESAPAWKYINGQLQQKPMPKTRHSLLQKRLSVAIDQHTDHYTALPELRCTFGDRSIVPDIAVIAWDRIPINAAGEPEDNFLAAPDWTIEILAPAQRATRVIGNVLHCLQHGCHLGWMLDPDDYSIWVFVPQQEPIICTGEHLLPVLAGIEMTLTVNEIFSWLKIRHAKESIST